MGSMLGIKAFVAAVLGGIGILPGAVTIEEALKSGGTNMERAV